MCRNFLCHFNPFTLDTVRENAVPDVSTTLHCSFDPNILLTFSKRTFRPSYKRAYATSYAPSMSCHPLKDGNLRNENNEDRNEKLKSETMTNEGGKKKV